MKFHSIKDFIKKFEYFYRTKSIQFVISISFTIVAVIGMAFLGFSLYLRFTTSTQNMISEDNKRLLDQVNINLDIHLRSMMNVSNSMYYMVIKNTDLQVDTLDSEMNLLYETNRSMIVSISIFEENGKLVSSTPVSNLKKLLELQRKIGL